MGLYRCTGVVLRNYKLGEADRIVSIATDERGKVRAVAKGVRKTKSRLGARLEPTSHVALLVYEGRELDVISQAEAVDAFPNIRSDLDRLTHANALLEAVDLISHEGKPDARLYEMLVGALRTLEGGDSPVLVGAFYWKLLAHEGYSPSLDLCVRCGAEIDAGRGGARRVGFDVSAIGVTCRGCTLGTVLGDGTLDLLRDILGGRLNTALREGRTKASEELERLAVAAVERLAERKLKTGHVDGQR